MSIQFNPSPVRPPRRGLDRAAMVAVLLASLVVVAIVKPWQGRAPVSAAIAPPTVASSPLPSAAAPPSPTPLPTPPQAPSPVVTVVGETVHITSLGRATSPEFELSGTVEMRASVCWSNQVPPLVWVYNERHATVAVVAQATFELRNLAKGKYYVTTSTNPDCTWSIDFAPKAAIVVAAQPDSPASRVAAALSMFGPGSPGCAVGIAQAGAVRYAQGFGMADVKAGVAITPNTVFTVGSLSAQFTGAAIMLLAQDGRLSLNDEIQRYVPELPAYGTQVTLRQLLDQTSGIPDYEDPYGPGPGAGRPSTAKQVLAVLAKKRRLDFRPGSRFEYSASNDVLLGLVVERLSGQSLRQFAAQRIFAPLGMTSTVFRDPGRPIANGAIGYELLGSNFVPGTADQSTVGDGSVETNLLDLLRWANHLRPGPTTVGLLRGTYQGLTNFTASGAWTGYTAAFIVLPERRLTVALTCNLPGDALSLALRVLDHWGLPEPLTVLAPSGPADRRAFATVPTN